MKMLTSPYRPHCVTPPGGDQNACLDLCLYRSMTAYRQYQQLLMAGDKANETRLVDMWPYHFITDSKNAFINCIRECRQPSCLTENYQTVSSRRYLDSSETLLTSNILLDTMSIETEFIP